VFWKILGVIALVWIAFIVVGALIKLVMPVIIIGALATGGYVIYKAVKGPSSTDVTRY
jgi:hypothetical protein